MVRIFKNIGMGDLLMAIRRCSSLLGRTLLINVIFATNSDDILGSAHQNSGIGIGKRPESWDFGILRLILGASLDLHITTLTLSLIITLRLTLTIQPYPNPTDPNPNCNHDIQI